MSDRRRKPLSEEHRAKISASQKGRVRHVAVAVLPQTPTGAAVDVHFTVTMEELAQLPRPQRDALLEGIGRLVAAQSPQQTPAKEP